jgi:hypothetical protein
MILVHDGMEVDKGSSTNEEAVQTSAQATYNTAAKWEWPSH